MNMITTARISNSILLPITDLSIKWDRQDASEILTFVIIRIQSSSVGGLDMHMRVCIYGYIYKTSL